MSRSGYSEDCEYINLWRGTVERSIQGKRGQLFLKDLIQALEDMPERRLIRGALKHDGEVCAIGALGLKRGVRMEHLEPDDSDQVGAAFGISAAMAAEIVYQNDERYRSAPPEERWEKMHKWAKDNFKSEAS